MSISDETIEVCKVVLLGESGVGKTSIIAQYINNEFTSNKQSTIGASYSTKSITLSDIQREVKFEIWDTAGQEKYKALTPMFYKDASAAVFVYDITREDSFNALKNYWIDQVQKNGPTDMVFSITANKSDLYEEEKVEQKKGIELAESINGIFKLTSAKNKVGIHSMFTELAKRHIQMKEERRISDNHNEEKFFISNSRDMNNNASFSCCSN